MGMYELINRLKEVFDSDALGDFLFDVILGGHKIGLSTAYDDLDMDREPEPDNNAIRNIGLRAHTLSDSTISQAKGALAYNGDKLLNEVQAKIDEGMSEREALGQVEDRVKKLFEESFPEWKLERLVRDQWLVSTKEGRRKGWSEGGVQYRKWQMHEDEKTADDSKLMHGQIQPINEPYVNPKNGDKYMVPHIRPNDRCYEVPLFELPENIKYKKGQMYDANDIVKMVEKGGQGSGNWGHKGRPGRIGGSSKSGEAQFIDSLKDKSIDEIADTVQEIIDNDNSGKEFSNDTGELLHNWFEGNQMHTLEHVFVQCFDMEKEYVRNSDRQIGDVSDKTKDNLRKIYWASQEVMKRKYPDGKVPLYRGVSSKVRSKMRNLEMSPGDEHNFEVHNLTSWTTDYDVANQFAEPNSMNDYKKGAIISAEDDVSNIFVCPDIVKNDEYVGQWSHQEEHVSIASNKYKNAKIEEIK